MSDDVLKKLFFVGIIAVALLQVFAHGPVAYSADDCSYLDQAVLFSQFDFMNGINGYWSPLYPLLCGLMFKIFNPPLAQQLFAVKVLNVFILAIAMIAFNFFFTRFLIFKNSVITGEGHAQLSQRQWIILAGCLFSWTFLTAGGAHQPTPDYLVAASLFTATGIAIGTNEKSSIWQFALLGVVLGLGYLAKASMIPVTVALVFLAALRVPKLSKKIVSAALAFLAVAVIACPYWTVLTIKKGSLDIGSSAGLNYMLWITHEYKALGGNKPDVEKNLVHSVKNISSKPRIAVFEDVLPGTFPPWFDPGYFALGLKVKFDPIASLIALITNFAGLYCLFGWQLTLVWLAGRISAPPLKVGLSEIYSSAIIWLPSVLTILSFCLIISIPLGFSAPRLFSAKVVLIYLAYFALRKFADDQKGKTALVRSMITACALSLLFVGARVAEDTVRLFHGVKDVEAKVAIALKEKGLQPGDKVVLVGLDGSEWARIAELRIVAVVESYDNEHDGNDTLVLESAIDKLKTQTGAKAAVYFPQPLAEHLIVEDAFLRRYRKTFSAITHVDLKDPPERTKFSNQALSRWQKLDNVDAYVYFLR